MLIIFIIITYPVQSCLLFLFLSFRLLSLAFGCELWHRCRQILRPRFSLPNCKLKRIIQLIKILDNQKDLRERLATLQKDIAQQFYSVHNFKFHWIPLRKRRIHLTLQYSRHHLGGTFHGFESLTSKPKLSWASSL